MTKAEMLARLLHATGFHRSVDECLAFAHQELLREAGSQEAFQRWNTQVGDAHARRFILERLHLESVPWNALYHELRPVLTDSLGIAAVQSDPYPTGRSGSPPGDERLRGGGPPAYSRGYRNDSKSTRTNFSDSTTERETSSVRFWSKRLDRTGQRGVAQRQHHPAPLSDGSLPFSRSHRLFANRPTSTRHKHTPFFVRSDEQSLIVTHVIDDSVRHAMSLVGPPVGTQPAGR